jgi:hypothetical protein
VPLPRWLTTVAVFACLVVPTATGAGAASLGSQRLVGHDGLLYESAPLVVNGLDGDMFLGLEFDLICAWGGKRLDGGLRRLGRLANLIERSGRRVIFTIAPDKSVINRQNVVPSSLPQGDCDSEGMAQQVKVLDTFPDPNYLSLRKTLDHDSRQMYWKTDGHWTTVGASKWVLKLARELDPKLAQRQRYAPTTDTQVGYLNQIRGITTTETVPGLTYAGKVKVQTAPGSPYDLTPGGPFAMDHRWNSSPASMTWPGHTMLVGDSFTLMALYLLRPLFRHGRFVWVGNVPLPDIADGIADADTVVIEVVQFFGANSPLGTPAFRHLVAEALAKQPGHA